MRYHNITKDDMLNGDGLRVVLWVSGCNHCCNGCHNTITWDCNGGLPFDLLVKSELYTELSKDYISGITISGGDPLHPVNREEIGSLVKEIKEKFPTKTIWLYTGYEYHEVKDLDFILWIDVMVDGKFIKELHNSNLYWRGSSNQKVIHISETIKKDQVVLWCD